MTHRSTLQALYLQYDPLVRRVIGKRCDKQDVDDVAASLWARLQKTWPLPEVDNVGAYLTTAAKNEVAMFFRERSAKKRPTSAARVKLPEDNPSGVTVDERFVSSPGVAGQVDDDRLSDRFRALSEELSGTSGDIMRRFLDDPSSVSRPELGRCTAAARRKIKAVGRDVDPLKEGPSFLGHVVERIRKAKKDQD